MDEQALGLLEGWFLGTVELALAPRCWLSKECHFMERELRPRLEGRGDLSIFRWWEN